jgi:uroporphyrinogen decarboxylase
MPTPRENVLRCLKRQGGFDAVPFGFDLSPAMVAKFKAATGRADGNYADYYGFPLRGGTAYRSSNHARDWSGFYPRPLKAGTTINEFGVAYEPSDSKEAFHLTHMLHPMETFDSVEQIEAWPWPVLDAGRFEGSAAGVAGTKSKGYAAAGWMACTIWETAWYLRGMENLMMDMSAEDPKAIALLDRITGISCERAGYLAASGIDVLGLGDDIGMQQGMLMAPAFWMEWLQPRLKRVIDCARAAAPGDLLILYHTCGFAEPAIQGLIDAGVDILNPVQPECMDFVEIHKRYGDRLSFHGTIGTQTTMPFGTPQEVKHAVRRNLEQAGPTGGLMPAPTHLVEPEVPWANVEAFVEACQDYLK